MQKRKKLTFRNIVSIFGALLLISGIIVCFIGAGVVSSCMIEAIDFSPEDFQIGMTSTIYYLDDNDEPKFYQNVNSESNRQWIKYDKIPQDMIDAAIAIEDERFYSHNGVDLKRTIGAVIVNLIGSDTYGGSTITQQVVKNITKDDERDALRKVREIFRAIKFESEYSKDEIMEFYLNIAHFGSGNGIQAASYAFFGKSVTDLNLAECASIVGITKYPTRYNPLINPEKNKERQEIVLSQMLKLGKITQEEYEEAINYKLEFSPSKGVASGSRQSYFTELVIDEVLNDLISKEGYSEAVAKSLIYNGGLTIYSTVDPKIQVAMENVLEDRNNFTSSSTVQAAMVIMDPYTGQVKGCVGGAGPKDRDLGLNRAVDTYRQPGSTIKPLAVYGPAIETGIISGPGTTIEDKELNINGYSPKNWYSGYKGLTTIREAIIQSMNTPAVQTVDKMGVDVSLSYLKNKYEISSISERDGLASVSLGGLTNGVSVLEWTAAYATFPNDGVWISPCSYTKVVDHSGKVILEKEQHENLVFSDETNFLITDILNSTAESSLIGGAISGMTCAGKTGTTNNNVDKWYMGFTPYYVGGVWVGNDNSKPMNNGQTLSSPQKIWRKVMTEVHKGLSNIGFASAPSNIQMGSVCTYTGKLASETCNKAYDYVNIKKIKYCSGDHPLEDEENPENLENPENTEENNGQVDENQSTNEGETPENTVNSGENTPPIVTPPENTDVTENNTPPASSQPEITE